MRLKRALCWLDARLPLSTFWRRHFSHYYVPKNLDFWYFFGVIALLVLLLELVTGIFLAMHYKPYAGLNAAGVPVAFASLETIMRDVSWGWLLRKAHALGASALFAIIYLHVFRSLLYGSYRKPRELVWVFGITLLLFCLAEAFFGRLLPWGQDGYWGTTVVLNLVSAIPVFGTDVASWLRGGSVVGDATLGRFFVLHVVVLPTLLLLLSVLHLISVRSVGSSNPDGIELDQRDSPEDFLPYHPYFTVRDLLAILVFLFVFFALVFFAADLGIHFLEFGSTAPADLLKTPEHVRPAWYYAPFFAMMRTITWSACGVDARFWGGLVMSAAVLVLALLPWLDASPVRSMRYRGPVSRILLAGFALVFLLLVILGCLPSTPKGEILVRFCTFYYFAFFLLMPAWSRLDRSHLPPDHLVLR